MEKLIWMTNHTQVLSNIENRWDSFFLSAETVSDDFMQEREMSIQPERESF